MKNNFAVKWVLLALAVLGFLCFDADFRGPDEPVYLAYTASMVSDGDFNVLDEVVEFTRQNGSNSHIRTLDRVNITPTGFLPDYHNHAGSVVWAVFYTYSIAFERVVDYFFPLSFDPDRVAATAMAFSTLLLGMLAFCGIYYLLLQCFSTTVSLLGTLVVLFGTPAFYFLTRETGNGQAMAGFLAVLSVVFWSYAHKMGKFDYFLYGLFFGMCAVIKIDLVFQAFFIASYFALLFYRRQTTVVKGVLFAVGGIFPLGLKLFNDFVKYGALRQGEASLLNFKSFYFFEQLFSSYRGFFYTSPVLVLCLAGLVLYALDFFRGKPGIKAQNDGPGVEALVFCLGVAFVAKLFILSFRYAWGGGTPGARILISESVLFAFLWARVCVMGKGKVFKVVFGVFTACCVVWNFVVIGEFINGTDLMYMTNPPALLSRFGVLAQMLPAVFGFSNVAQKLSVLFLPLVALGCFVVFGQRFLGRFFRLGTGRFKGVMPLRPNVVLRFAGVWLFVVYLAFSVSNGLCCAHNVSELKRRGYYKNTFVVARKDFENNENLGSLDEMEAYFKAVGKTDMVDKVKRIRREY